MTMMEPQLKVGIGISDITPDVGMFLSGFIFRENKPSSHIDDHLNVQALVMCQGGEPFFLISYELLALSEFLEQKILTALESAPVVDFSKERCVLLATHTHSAPPTNPLEGESGVDPSYAQLLCNQTIDSVQQAIKSMTPVTLHYHSLRIPGLTYNRRAVLTDGQVSMALKPDAPVLMRGPVDDHLTVLIWRDRNGKNIAAALHFACHGDAVCTQGIGGDVPGELSRRLGSILKAPCLFLQGAAGDINPSTVAASRTEMLSLSEQFMKNLVDLPERLQPLSCTPLRTTSTTLPLKYQPLPERSIVERKIKNFNRIAHGDIDAPDIQETLHSLGNILNIKPGERPDPIKAAYAARAMANAQLRVLEAINSGKSLPDCPLRISLLRMGQIIFAFVAAELFSITGFRIRALANEHALLPVTYAAPIVGYVPDQVAMNQGGYEVDDAWQFYRHPAPFIVETEQLIVETIKDLTTQIDF